jgi:hypothetical protein
MRFRSSGEEKKGISPISGGAAAGVSPHSGQSAGVEAHSVTRRPCLRTRRILKAVSADSHAPAQRSRRRKLTTGHSSRGWPKRNLELTQDICILTRTIARGRKKAHATSPAIVRPFARSRQAPAPATPHPYAGVGMSVRKNRSGLAQPFFGRALESEPAPRPVARTLRVRWPR